jgi:hypothetical protein
MRPSRRRAAIRAVRPHRSHVPTVVRAAQASQIRPCGPSRFNTAVTVLQSAQPGRTTSTWPASCSTWARRITTAGHRELAEVNASG